MIKGLVNVLSREKGMRSLMKLKSYKFGMLDNYQKKQEQKEFQKTMDFFLSRDSFTLLDYKQFVNDQLTRIKKGVIRKMFSNSEENEQELMEGRKIMDAMFDEEMIEFRKILNSPDLQKEIIDVAQSTQDHFDDLQRGFDNMRFAHHWLINLKTHKKTIPKNQDELQFRIRKERKIPYKDQKEIRVQKRSMVLKMRKNFMKERIQKKRDKKRGKKQRVYKRVYKNIEEIEESEDV